MHVKSSGQLRAILDRPDDWLPEALEAAREELATRCENGNAAGLLPQPSEPAALDQGAVERPTGLTLACVLGFMFSSYVILGGFYTQAHPRVGLSRWLSPILLLGGICQFACAVGLWQMYRAAYIALAIYVCLVGVAAWHFAPRLLAIAVVPFVLQLAVGGVYFRKMQ